MRRTAMSLTAATSGFVVFLLTVPVVQGQNGWGVTYTSHICALKGSTVDIHCTYRYPSRVNDRNTAVEERYWFTKLQDDEPVDLRTDSEYAGRVQHHCDEKKCTLRITDLRERDSAEYSFRFITNQPGGHFTGSPGVTLTVTDLQVTVNNPSHCKINPCVWAKLSCHSMCRLPDHYSYIWYINGQKIQQYTSSISGYFYDQDSFSCAVRGYEHHPAPSVCARGQSCNRVIYTDRSICAFRGSSVDISCTYNIYGHISSSSSFWFSPDRSHQWQNPSQPEGLSKDSQYAGRVQLLKTERGRSTLRMSNLRESDSAQYHFTFKTQSFEWGSSLPGTTLTVTDPDVTVQVFQSSSGPKLICFSSCLHPGRSSYAWYRNEEKIQQETSPSYRGSVNPAHSYSCAINGYRSLPVYAPKVPFALKSPSDNIMEGSSVSLTCSSDANPAAKYTWYKKNQMLLNNEPQLIFNNIQSSDSGEYYCTAENELEKKTSEYIFIDVRYAPKLPSLSINPSDVIVEGSSVTLTCSSDANPAANYTWYKENQTLRYGPEYINNFTSISSEDSGSYHCKSENQYGQINSSSLVLDVQYGPRLPSVSVSPSAQIVEGSSVNLTCSSDANPAANYTWYKENEDSQIASGQIFTIIHFRPEHSGNYYCEAQNRRGRHNSTIYLTLVGGAHISAATGTIAVLLLAIIIIVAAFLWIRRKRTQQSEPGGSTDNRAQLGMCPVNDSSSAATQREAAGGQDDLHYASICFSQNQPDALYSNITAAKPPRTTGEEEDDAVEYSSVKFDSSSSASGTRQQEAGDELFALYSTVN